MYARELRTMMARAQVQAARICLSHKARLTAPDLREYVADGQMDRDLGIFVDRDRVRLHVPAYRKFYARVRVTLNALGYISSVWVDSGERRHYGLVQEQVLYCVTRVDPLFTGPAGKVLTRLAEKRRA